MKNLSENFRGFIRDVIKTPEFWKINYYLRSMKKAPHGGIFHNTYPNLFLKNYTFSFSRLFQKNKFLPLPLIETANKVRIMFEATDLDIEELLCFCFRPETNNGGGDLIYLAIVGKIIKYRGPGAHDIAVMDAADGKKTYADNFDIDMDRFICAFICRLVEECVYRIYDVGEILSHECIELPRDKYGLTDVTDAEFLRQGFRLNDKYYLYNIFLDTSIGSVNPEVPNTIEIMQQIKPSTRILTRCDNNLAVPYSQMVGTATWDAQKYRGITLNFENISEQLRRGKETIIHYDPKTNHRILLYIKKAIENGTELYHLNVEQIWNPDIFASTEPVIMTNYIHGTYYPTLEKFDHIDFSVNQYTRDVFELKYRDAEQQTGISIGEYADEHYKVWCVKGGNLSTEVWAQLVYATLDEPFRNIFLETIGGGYTEEETT
jgi:hypothetical protein